MLFLVAFVAALGLFLRRRREARPATPALRIAGGPPDDGEDASAGKPLLDAIAASLRAGGAELSAVEADDWGYSVDAIIAGRPLRLRLGSHGANGVGRIWLLVLEGAGADTARAVETAVAAVAGVRVLGWDD